MARKVNTTLLGLFVLVAIVFAVAAIGLFGSGRLFRKLDRYVVFFPESATGLAIGAPVRFRGVPLGTVVDMQAMYIAEGQRFLTPVYFEIDRHRIRNLGVPAGTKEEQQRNIARVGIRAQLVTDSLVTGQRAVALDLKPESPAIFVRADQSVPEIATVSSSLEEISKKLEDLPIQELTERLAETLRVVHTTFADPDLAAGIREIAPTIQELRGALVAYSRDLQPALVRIAQKVENLNLERALLRIETSLDSLDAAAIKVGSFAARGVPVADEADRAFDQITAAARELRQVAEMIQRHPEVLLTGKRG